MTRMIFSALWFLIGTRADRNRFNTSLTNRRGRILACICMDIDLAKPLVAKLLVNGNVQPVEYEDSTGFDSTAEKLPLLNPGRAGAGGLIRDHKSAPGLWVSLANWLCHEKSGRVYRACAASFIRVSSPRHAYSRCMCNSGRFCNDTHEINHVLHFVAKLGKPRRLIVFSVTTAPPGIDCNVLHIDFVLPVSGF
ncbi:unnamed protein product [Dovyalis caffra]|uniref:Uncharacterized protein n=1 Tax=Dovyalis caffra TaxID=77055 RepID=A0AAV1RZ64_9ROSI|nr:unnamed protein product [Dovyalis caffra]